MTESTVWMAALTLGGKIKTKCVNVADVGLSVPQTVAELTERVAALLPAFAGYAKPGRRRNLLWRLPFFRPYGREGPVFLHEGKGFSEIRTVLCENAMNDRLWPPGYQP